MANYKQQLKEDILKTVKELSPEHSSHERMECPNCQEEDAYLYYPEFKYGRCVDCSYEEGFEYYTAIMGSRIKQIEVFKEVYSAIDKALSEI